jgi:hypothetical protein
MGYNVEISFNMLKGTNFSDLKSSIEDIANSYECENFYSIYEENGTIKIPRYHCVFVIHFIDENFDNFIKFLRIIKHSKKGFIESIYNNDIHKLLYASSYYLSQIGKEAAKNYKNFIKNKNFTTNEITLLKVFLK